MEESTMTTKYINERTAYMYAMHEADTSIYDRRQDLLASLILLPSEIQSYEIIFQNMKNGFNDYSFFLDLHDVNETCFWIYAYAQQAKQFHHKLKDFIFDSCFLPQTIMQQQLSDIFLQCYTVIESGYPEIFVFDKTPLQCNSWRNSWLEREIGNDQKFERYFEAAIRESELSTYNRYYHDFEKCKSAISSKDYDAYTNAMDFNTHAVQNHESTKPLAYFLSKKAPTAKQIKNYWTVVMFKQCCFYKKRLREEHLNVNQLETDTHMKQLVRVFIECYPLFPDDSLSLAPTATI